MIFSLDTYIQEKQEEFRNSKIYKTLTVAQAGFIERGIETTIRTTAEDPLEAEREEIKAYVRTLTALCVSKERLEIQDFQPLINHLAAAKERGIIN